MATVLMAVAAFFAATIVYVKWRDSSATRKAAGETERQRFHAVAVRPGLQSCRSARLSNGTRYLSNEAPHLPLPGCDQANCSCHFVHFADRRAGDDRRTPFQRSITASKVEADGERRSLSDRRRDAGNDELQFG